MIFLGTPFKKMFDDGTRTINQNYAPPPFFYKKETANGFWGDPLLNKNERHHPRPSGSSACIISKANQWNFGSVSTCKKRRKTSGVEQRGEKKTPVAKEVLVFCWVLLCALWFFVFTVNEYIWYDFIVCID